MKQLIFFFFSIFFTFLSQTYAQNTINSQDAANHIGDTVFVKGKVAAVYEFKAGNTFINFDYDFPNVTFVVVKFAKTEIDISEIKPGCILTVYGMIKLYNDKPEIILNSADQIILNNI